jgi:hypothetical protein
MVSRESLVFLERGIIRNDLCGRYCLLTIRAGIREKREKIKDAYAHTAVCRFDNAGFIGLEKAATVRFRRADDGKLDE